LCKPGGRIVYASCTYAPEENEAVINALLREVGRDTLRLLPARVEGFWGSEGLTEWDGEAYDDSLRLALRVWPHQNDTGGFFVALLEKVRSEQPAEDRDKGNSPEGGELCASSDGSDRMARESCSPPDSWLEILEQRFGMPHQGFEGYRFFQRTARDLRVANRDHRPPHEPEPQSTGMVFMRAQSRFPKLTTAAAMIFGETATRNTVELDAEQIQSYVQREELRLREDQVRSCTGIGYVLVRYQEVEFGVALYLPDEQGKTGRIKSLFPKAWAVR
jgi:NOL1/NOP2/fmu family ribosome biogenesis protein